MQRIIAAAVLLLALPGHPATAAERALTVVELFTSQGCSSCPPADALLGELAGRDDVLALSMHVDYWDCIGWKDPFASPETTRRQRDYARRFGLRYVYTPQIVVHGSAQVTGSHRAEVLGQIARVHDAAAVAVTMRQDDSDVIAVTVGAGRVDGEAAIWLAMVDRRHVTRIARGENRGIELSNYNVVRQLKRIGTWDGAETTIQVTMEGGDDRGDLCAVFVQSENSGAILGAARFDLVNR